jgi:hypothetical protein
MFPAGETAENDTEAVDVAAEPAVEFIVTVGAEVGAGTVCDAIDTHAPEVFETSSTPTVPLKYGCPVVADVGRPAVVPKGIAPGVGNVFTPITLSPLR